VHPSSQFTLRKGKNRRREYYYDTYKSDSIQNLESLFGG
jgi:hypothetical protein